MSLQEVEGAVLLTSSSWAGKQRSSLWGQRWEQGYGWIGGLVSSWEFCWSAAARLVRLGWLSEVCALVRQGTGIQRQLPSDEEGVRGER